MPPEDVRYEVRRHLAARPTASLDVASIKHGLHRKGLGCDDEEIESALAFLAGLNPPQVQTHLTALGSTRRHQITSAGVLAFERNE